MVPDEMKFETLVDDQSTAFQEYVSAIIAKLPKSNKEYKAIQNEIKAIYEQYPNVYGACQGDKPAKPACGFGNAVGLLPWLL